MFANGLRDSTSMELNCDSVRMILALLPRCCSTYQLLLHLCYSITVNRRLHTAHYTSNKLPCLSQPPLPHELTIVVCNFAQTRALLPVADLFCQCSPSILSRH